MGRMGESERKGRDSGSQGLGGSVRYFNPPFVRWGRGVRPRDARSKGFEENLQISHPMNDSAGVDLPRSELQNTTFCAKRQKVPQTVGGFVWELLWTSILLFSFHRRYILLHR